MSLSHGDRFALPRPLTEKEKEAHKEKVSSLPTFRYHPDPLGTGSFKEGGLRPVLRVGRPHHLLCSETLLCGGAKPSLSNLYCYRSCCPKFEAEFIQDADWQGGMDKEKDQVLFCQTPGYSSWQGNIGSLVAETTVPIWGQLALVNWKKWALQSKS